MVQQPGDRDFIKWVKFENDIQVFVVTKPGFNILLQKLPAMNSPIMT